MEAGKKITSIIVDDIPEAAEFLETALKGELASPGLPPALQPRLAALAGRDKTIISEAGKWFKAFTAERLAGLADGDAEQIAGIIEAESRPSPEKGSGRSVGLHGSRNHMRKSRQFHFP